MRKEEEWEGMPSDACPIDPADIVEIWPSKVERTAEE